MTKKEFLDLVNIHKVILDGATGSNLQKRGMPTGVCPEEWILENADVMCGLQREYIQAGRMCYMHRHFQETVLS